MIRNMNSKLLGCDIQWYAPLIYIWHKARSQCQQVGGFEIICRKPSMYHLLLNMFVFNFWWCMGFRCDFVFKGIGWSQVPRLRFELWCPKGPVLPTGKIPINTKSICTHPITYIMVWYLILRLVINKFAHGIWVAMQRDFVNCGPCQQIVED